MAIIAPLLAVLGLGLEVVGTPIFLLFILEESVQAAGFGVFALMQAKQWKAAREQVKVYRKIALKMKDACETLLSIGTPFAGAEVPNSLVGIAAKQFESVRILLGEAGVAPPKAQAKVDILKAFITVLVDPFLTFANAALSSADAFDRAITERMLEEN